MHSVVRIGLSVAAGLAVFKGGAWCAEHIASNQEAANATAFQCAPDIGKIALPGMPLPDCLEDYPDSYERHEKVVGTHFDSRMGMTMIDKKVTYSLPTRQEFLADSTRSQEAIDEQETRTKVAAAFIGSMIALFGSGVRLIREEKWDIPAIAMEPVCIPLPGPVAKL